MFGLGIPSLIPSPSYLLSRYLNTVFLHTDLLRFCNFRWCRSIFTSFQAWTALDLMLLVPYNTVSVLKFTSWLSLSFLVLPAVCTKLILSSRRGVGRFLLIWSWANRQFSWVMWSFKFNIPELLKSGVAGVHSIPTAEEYTARCYMFWT